jgi:NAD-reducing hydrogenase small subunit
VSKLRLATVWLDGCSGCHMSFLDLDERLLAVAEKADLVYSPLVDVKEFPPDVDVTLVEGAVSSEEDLHKIQRIRQRTDSLAARAGDCARQQHGRRGRGRSAARDVDPSLQD